MATREPIDPLRTCSGLTPRRAGGLDVLHRARHLGPINDDHSRYAVAVFDKTVAAHGVPELF